MTITDIDDVKQLSIELHLDTTPDNFNSFSTTTPVCPSLTSSMQNTPDPMTPFPSDMLDMVMTSEPSLACIPAELNMAGIFQYNDSTPDDGCFQWSGQESKQPTPGQSAAFATAQYYSTKQPFQEVFLSPDQGLAVGAALESSLSRSIFHHRPQSESFTTEHMTRWQPSLLQTPPRTVAPSATFQPTLPSSPAYRVTPSTPVQNQYQDSTMSAVIKTQCSSSPTHSPFEQPVFFKSEFAGREIQPTLVRSLRESRGKGASRHGRKSAEKKDGGRCRRSSKPGMSRSGLNYPSYIEGNSHACTSEDCVDKAGKRKKFKRQEHLKRHQKTCHTGKRPYKCWVDGCTTKPFSRTDNLKSHLHKTHGKKSPAARNRYIATLDRNSGVYDENYRGPFTESGWPIGSK